MPAPGQPVDFESGAGIQFLRLYHFSRVHSSSKMYRFLVISDKVFYSYIRMSTVLL